MLPCPHHHIVFTTPQELVPLWRYNKALFASTLFAAASQTLAELLSDARYLGAKPGMLAALHTWSQTLAAHVHLHVLVTAGGLTDEGQWRTAKKECLLPRKVLMIKFRGKFRAMLLDLIDRQKLKVPPDCSVEKLKGTLNRLGRLPWNVKLLERYDHGHGVATYLANYLKGGPIGNHRILSASEDEVVFRYRQPTHEHGQAAQQGTVRLHPVEFIARILEHVPPRRLQTVRGYGLYSGNQHSRLPEAHRALGCELSAAEPPLSWEAFLKSLGHEPVCKCPICGAELITIHSTACVRGPPVVFSEVAEFNSTSAA